MAALLWFFTRHILAYYYACGSFLNSILVRSVSFLWPILKHVQRCISNMFLTMFCTKKRWVSSSHLIRIKIVGDCCLFFRRLWQIFHSHRKDTYRLCSFRTFITAKVFFVLGIYMSCTFPNCLPKSQLRFVVNKVISMKQHRGPSSRAVANTQTNWMIKGVPYFFLICSDVAAYMRKYAFLIVYLSLMLFLVIILSVYYCTRRIACWLCW